MPDVRFVVFAVMTIGVGAQGPTLRQLHRMLPPESSAHWGTAAAPAWGDIDGDGRTDCLLIGSSDYAGPRHVVWRGTADGGMAEIPNALPNILHRAVESQLSDLDLDGDLDCVVFNAPMTATPCSAPYGTGVSSDLFWNDGTGHFALGASLLPTPGCPNHTCVVVGDVDGDGDPDVVAGAKPYVCTPNPQQPWVFTTHLGENHLYLNDGSGGFTLGVGRLPPHTDFTNELVLADFDGDGDLDLFAGNEAVSGANSRIYTNDGSGLFTELVAALPLNTIVAPRGSAHAHDFDGDGDLDLLLRTADSFVGLRFLRNGGGGLFTDASAALPMTGPASKIVVADWNGDQHPDFLLAVGGTVFLVTNQGGLFTVTATWVPMGLPFSWDLEADGDADVIEVGNRYTIRRNNGAGQFHTVAQDLPLRSNPVRALVDLDRDGDLDGLAVGVSPAEPAYVLRNEGNGRFTAQVNGQFSTYGGDMQYVLAGDIDGDGDDDVLTTSFVWSAFGMCRLFRNVGGSLQTASFPALAARCAAFGDVDGDGDLDVYLGNAGSTDQVLRNDGTGVFTPIPGAVSLVTHTEDVALADVDGDGDLDAVLASWLSLNRVLRNDGSGGFVDSGFAATDGTAVKAADFDGDGDQDLVFCNSGGVQPDRLYRNNGLGTFVLDPTSFPSPSLASRLMRIGDVDGDGDTDIVRVHSTYVIALGDNRLQLLCNDGTGHFTVGELNDVTTWWLELGDLDGDGDGDVLLSQDELRIHWNVAHQVTWRSLPRVGWPFELDLYGSANEPYVLGLALAPANLPIPGLGRLRLDPASLAVVQLGAYDSGGRAAFTAGVPLDPSLVGLTIHWQALAGIVPRLGNLESTTFAVH